MFFFGGGKKTDEKEAVSEILKSQMENENQSLKYTYFCEVLNSPTVQSLIKDKLSEITVLSP